MKKATENIASIFWSTITVLFVLLVHNGREPLYLIALTGIPILKKSNMRRIIKSRPLPKPGCRFKMNPPDLPAGKIRGFREAPVP